MIKYKVTKNDGSIHDVLLIPIKNTSKYHFVNITKGHICTCEFNNIEEAEKDIQKRLEDKLLKSFIVFNEKDEKTTCMTSDIFSSCEK